MKQSIAEKFEWEPQRIAGAAQRLGTPRLPVGPFKFNVTKQNQIQSPGY
jgi:hypothetical protein